MTSSFTAVIDTNVMFEFYSISDLVTEYDQLGPDGVHSKRAIWRRARARETLLLAMYLNRVKAVTYSLHREGLELLQGRVDPAALDSRETHFTIFVLHFVKEQILPAWRASVVKDNDLGVKGNRADRLLLDYAKEHDLPLITNEGFTPEGIQEHKLRDAAVAENVDVFTPGEFIAGKIDESAAIAEFLAAFNSKAPAYIAAHPSPKVVRESLLFHLSAYRHILLGETDTKGIVPVTLG